MEISLSTTFLLIAKEMLTRERVHSLQFLPLRQYLLPSSLGIRAVIILCQPNDSETLLPLSSRQLATYSAQLVPLCLVTQSWCNTKA